MIKFDKLEKIYKDKKETTFWLILNIILAVFDISMFIVYLITGNIVGIATTGVFIGVFGALITALAIMQTSINKAYKEEQAKIEFETFVESQKILMSAFEQLDKKLKEKRSLAKEKEEQEKAKAEAEKPKAKKNAEPKAKAETKTTKKKN